MDKQTILQNIERLSFPSDLSPIFAIIKDHIDRFEFTKDYSGLRDFIYLAETNAIESEYPFFACFDFNDNDSNQNEGVYSEVVYEVREMCKQMLRFLKQSKRTIYISIGFKESILTTEDILYIHTMLEKRIIRDKHEGETQLRHFPEWYVAKYPNEIVEDQEMLDLLDKLKKREIRLTNELKKNLLSLIDDALDKRDSNSYHKLTAKLNKMENLNNKIDLNSI